MCDRNKFFEPETRCDTYISAERKAAWKVMLDILEEIVRVCDKYDLPYHLDGGSMLGAIRHGGIIPWDDDIDIAMFRKDYDRLQEVLPKELPPHLFMQTALTDEEYPIAHLKVRDSRTTGVGIFYAQRRQRFNMGIFVDVFPIDGVPNDARARTRQLRKLKFYLHVRRNIFWHKFGSVFDVLKFVYARMIYCLVGRERLYRMQEDVCRAYPVDECRECSTGIALWGFKPNNRRRLEWFKEYKEVDFEYLRVKVPVAAEVILTTIYGDWHKFVKGASTHGETVLEAHKDYRTFLKENYGYRDEDFRPLPY